MIVGSIQFYCMHLMYAVCTDAKQAGFGSVTESIQASLCQTYNPQLLVIPCRHLETIQNDSFGIWCVLFPRTQFAVLVHHSEGGVVLICNYMAAWENPSQGTLFFFKYFVLCMILKVIFFYFFFLFQTETKFFLAF